MTLGAFWLYLASEALRSVFCLNTAPIRTSFAALAVQAFSLRTSRIHRARRASAATIGVADGHPATPKARAAIATTGRNSPSMDGVAEQPTSLDI